MQNKLISATFPSFNWSILLKYLFLQQNMIRKLLFILLFLPLQVWSQRIWLMVGPGFIEVPAEQTQTEVRPGWRIVDIQLRDHTTRYLQGRVARQLTDDRMPLLRVMPGHGETLVDYALIRLRQKRSYRQFSHPELRMNEYLRIEPANFSISVLNDSVFECRPNASLTPGSYVLTNLAQKPLGEMGDYTVFPLQVP